MAFATFIGSTSGQVQTSSGTWTIGWSDTMLAGDVILIGAARDGTADMTVSDAGFSSFVSQTNGAAMRGEVWWKVSTGGETGTVLNMTGERGSWHMRHYRDASGTPTATSTNGNSTTLDPPSHTAAGANDYTWITFAMWDESTLEAGTPAGYGNAVANPMSTGSGAGIASADRQIAATQTEDPAAWTLNALEQWGTFTIALQGPAVAAPTGMFAPCQLTWGYGV